MKNDVIYNGLEEMNRLIWDINSCFGILSAIYNNGEMNEDAFSQIALIAEVGASKIQKLIGKNEELTNTVLRNKLRRTQQI